MVRSNVAVSLFFAVEVEQFQQGIQSPVGASDMKIHRKDNRHANDQKNNVGLGLQMKKIEVKKNAAHDDYSKIVYWEITGLPVLDARLLQKFLAVPCFAQFQLGQDFLLFGRQFSDFGFGQRAF
jgi:hypothetical protein